MKASSGFCDGRNLAVGLAAHQKAAWSPGRCMLAVRRALALNSRSPHAWQERVLLQLKKTRNGAPEWYLRIHTWRVRQPYLTRYTSHTLPQWLGGECRCFTIIQIGTSGTDKDHQVLKTGLQLQKLQQGSLTKAYESIAAGVVRHCSWMWQLLLSVLSLFSVVACSYAMRRPLPLVVACMHTLRSCSLVHIPGVLVPAGPCVLLISFVL